MSARKTCAKQKQFKRFTISYFIAVFLSLFAMIVMKIINKIIKYYCLGVRACEIGCCCCCSDVYFPIFSLLQNAIENSLLFREYFFSLPPPPPHSLLLQIVLSLQNKKKLVIAQPVALTLFPSHTRKHSWFRMLARFWLCSFYLLLHTFFWYLLLWMLQGVHERKHVCAFTTTFEIEMRNKKFPIFLKTQVNTKSFPEKLDF